MGKDLSYRNENSNTTNSKRDLSYRNEDDEVDLSLIDTEEENLGVEDKVINNDKAKDSSWFAKLLGNVDKGIGIADSGVNVYNKFKSGSVAPEGGGKTNDTTVEIDTDRAEPNYKVWFIGGGISIAIILGILIYSKNKK